MMLPWVVAKRKPRDGVQSMGFSSAFAWLTRGMAGAAIFLAATVAQAEDKALTGIALVIGESAYEHLPALANPANDAKAIDRLLADLGFQVDLVQDADQKKLSRALRRFVEDAEGADVALIYYSGHGIEAGGENFLVPVDADVGALEAADAEMVPLSALLKELQATVPVTIVLLDACRTNPFPAGSTIKLAGAAEPAAVAAAGLGAPRGATALSGDKPKEEGFGSLLGFAAAPGEPALDGDPGGNSPYASALLKHLSAGGYDFSDMMTMVAEEVWLATDARQLPWTNTSLRRLLYFGAAVESDGDETAPIRGERRQLLLTMASVGEAERLQVASAARENGVPMGALFAMLKALGAEAPDDPEQFARLLEQQAERVKTLLAERDLLKQSDPEIARLSALAGQAVEEGALTAAVGFYEKAKIRVASLDTTLDDTEADLKARRIEHAAVYGASAETYALTYDYAAAAADFARAFGQVERWDDALALRYKQSEAKAWSDLGFFRADDAATERALAAYEEAARFAPADANPAGWADTQSGLAMAIWARGTRQSGTAEIERAASILEAAIASEAVAGDDNKRAQLQGDLALVLMTLGEREAGTETLERSVAAAHAAMAVRTREVAPLEWARLQNHLGSTLFLHGTREQSREKLEEAVAAFRAALEVWSPQNAPMDWANAQNNLALSLGELGSRDPDTARLKEAVTLLDAIFAVRTRKDAPLHWAETQSNLGATIYHIGLREEGTQWFEDGAAAFRLALEEITRERDPLKWAGIEDNLGLMLSSMAERTGNTAQLDEAIAAYRLALSERTRERVPLDWAATSNNLANALYRYGELTHEAKYFRDAVAVYEDTLSVRTRENDPIGWSRTQNNLANVLFSLGTHGEGPAYLSEAAKHYRLALEEYDRDTNAIGFADTNYNLALVLLELGKQTADRAVLAEAKVALDACVQVYHAAGQTQWDSYFENIEAAILLADTDLLVKEKLKQAGQSEGQAR